MSIATLINQTTGNIIMYTTNPTELALDTLRAEGVTASHKILVSIGPDAVKAYISDFGVSGAHLVYPTDEGIFAERYALAQAVEDQGGLDKTFKLPVEITSEYQEDEDTNYLQAKLNLGGATPVVLNMSPIADTAAAQKLAKLTEANVTIVKTMNIAGVKNMVSELKFS